MKLSLPRLAARQGLGEPFSHTFSPIKSFCLSTRSSSTLSFPQPYLQHSRRYISNAAASPKQESADRSEHPPSSKAHTPSTSSKLIQTTPASSISERVRLLMRRVPYPVAIITSTDPTGPADTTSFRGMTVSSFSTVTLTPEPVISFNVRRPSETLSALLASGRFLVHLLAPSPATATLARDFSKGNTTLAAMLSGHGEFEFAPLHSDGETERPLPILRRRGSDSDNRLDFPFVFECRLHPQKIDVQDHSIVLGTVLRTIEASGELLSGQSCAGESLDGHSPEHLCLTYANTKFWKMGGEI